MAVTDPKPIPELSQKQIESFWKYVNRSPGYGPNGDCWPRFRNSNRNGYGLFHLGNRQQRFGSHRSCNPAHLLKGTQAQNMADMVSKNRQATGDRCGVRLHPETRPRGKQHWAFKLTNEQKEEIRRRYKRGNGPTLAREFGCTNTTIHRIIHAKP